MNATHRLNENVLTFLQFLAHPKGNDNKYISVAESLRQRIVDVKVKIERQLGILEALKARVRQQVIEIQRLEVVSFIEL